MNTAIKSEQWRGLLASFFLPGAGQFLSGARRRGIIWFSIICGFPLLLLSCYSLPFVPAKSALILFALSLSVWLTMLWDSRRRINRLPCWGWVFLVLLSFAFSEMLSRLSRSFFQTYRVPTIAMAPTINIGDDILICRSAYWFQEPRRGDLIVFNTSGIKSIADAHSAEDVLFVKRIIGLPNDIVEIGTGDIRVNNTRMTFGDPSHPIQYQNAQTGTSQRGVESFAVPTAEYFVLGDNSANSYDSRYWGTIQRSAICGKVTKIYWPWSRMSTPW